MAEPVDLDLDDLLELLVSTDPMPKSGSCAKASTCLEKKDFAGALSHCEQALEEDPCNGLAMNLQIHVLFESDQKDLAMAKLGYLLKFFPNLQSANLTELVALFSDRDDEIGYLTFQVKACLEQRRFEDATNYCNDALLINPLSCQALCLQVQIQLSMKEFDKAEYGLRHLLKYYGQNKQVGFLARNYIEAMIAEDKFADALIFFVQFREDRSLALSYVGTACSRYAEYERKAVKELEDRNEQRLKLAEAEIVFREAIAYLQDLPIFLIQAFEGLLYVYLEWSKKFKDDKIVEMLALLNQAESLQVRVPPRIYAAFVFYYARKPSFFCQATEYLARCRLADATDEKAVQATRAYLGHLKEHRRTAANVTDREMKITRLQQLALVCKDALKLFNDREILAAISVNLLFIFLLISKMVAKSRLSDMLETLQSLEMVVDEENRTPEMYLPFVYYFTQVRKDKNQADYFMARCEQHICSNEKEYLEPAYVAYQVAFGTSFGIDQSS